MDFKIVDNPDVGKTYFFKSMSGKKFVCGTYNGNNVSNTGLYNVNIKPAYIKAGVDNCGVGSIGGGRRRRKTARRTRRRRKTRKHR